MAKKTIYETTITVKVLHEDAFDYENLEDVHHAITDGDCSGSFETTGHVVLIGKEAVKAVEAQGSDPEFFMMDENGNEIEG